MTAVQTRFFMYSHIPFKDCPLFLPLFKILQDMYITSTLHMQPLVSLWPITWELYHVNLAAIFQKLVLRCMHSHISSTNQHQNECLYLKSKLLQYVCWCFIWGLAYWNHYSTSQKPCLHQLFSFFFCILSARLSKSQFPCNIVYRMPKHSDIQLFKAVSSSGESSDSVDRDKW